MKVFKPLNGREVLASRMYKVRIAPKDKGNPNGRIVIRIPLKHGGEVTGHIVDSVGSSLMAGMPYNERVKNYMLELVDNLLDNGKPFIVKGSVAIEWRYNPAA